MDNKQKIFLNLQKYLIKKGVLLDPDVNLIKICKSYGCHNLTDYIKIMNYIK
jgi:hypothetical protein